MRKDKPITQKKRPAGNTRDRLLKEAIRLFSKYGYHGVSVDRIVAATKVNKRMVYHYFGNKESLYRAALLEVYQPLELLELAIFEKEQTPEEALRSILIRYFEFLANNHEFVNLLLWENLNEGRAIRKHSHLLTKNPVITRLEEVIAEGKKSGIFDRSVDAKHLLINFIGLCFIYHSNRYTLSQALEIDLGDDRVRKDGLEQALHLVFNGIRAEQ
jgi:TetR/AcrR family transcriptional regulator